MCTKKILVVVAVIAVFFTACKENNKDAITDIFEHSAQRNVDSDFIVYPPSGEYGANILSDDVTSVNRKGYYTMRADVPKGMSLKIVLRDGEWFIEGAPATPFNWKIGEYDDINLCQEFTVKESGKTCDLKLDFDAKSFSEYITIEYYENGSETPTKTKNLYVVN